MIKGILGSTFFLISAIFYSTRYICAAIGASNSSTWSIKEFDVFLKNVPNNLLVFSIVSLLIGFAFILWSFLDLKNKSND